MHLHQISLPEPQDKQYNSEADILCKNLVRNILNFPMQFIIAANLSFSLFPQLDASGFY